MIEAAELRIGNWVSVGGSENIRVQIKTIGVTGVNGRYEEDEDLISEGIDYEPYFNEIKFDDLQPIPLTLSILESAGFKKEQMGKLTDQYRFPKMYGQFSFIINENIVGDFVFRIWNDSNKTDTALSFCQYVHQLQNLFFTITKKELQINLNVETN